MRIKHFMGYGSVNAKVVKKTLNTATHNEGYIIKTLTINVWGNHECGLEIDDKYDINNWLVKKVAKVDIDYRDIMTMTYASIADIDDQEAVQYYIVYKEKW